MVRHEKDDNFDSTAVKHEKDKDLNSTAVKHEKEDHSNSTAAKHQEEKANHTGVTNNNTTSSKFVPADIQTNTGQHQGQEKSGSTTDSPLGYDISCAGLTKSCSILNTMVACALPSDPGNLSRLTCDYCCMVTLVKIEPESSNES